MSSIKKRILAEINKLRQLKCSVFGDDFQSCDIEASDVCLSADVLLVPLYWYWKEHFPNDSGLVIEKYLAEAIDTFPVKASELIHRLIIRTDELDQVYQTRPLESYRKLLLKCYPDTILPCR